MVTDSQVRRLIRLAKTERDQEIAAAKAGMDAKTARKYLRVRGLPSERREDRGWRTREDGFSGVWEEIRREIELNPGLEAKTLFEWLQRKYPDQYADGQLRTLQRRIKAWRATEGPGQEVYFSQKHEPGQLCASDFTHMRALEITINGQTLDHLVYHFVLTYSNWEAGTICYSESFESLSEGLQNALWELGGVPCAHRTDSLSSAVNNMSNVEEFTQRYEGLLKHYGLKPQRTNPGKAHENGDSEQSHHRFKKAVEQALLLRGSRDFGNVAGYQAFLRELMGRLNAGRRPRLAEEMALLKELPARRMESAKRERVRVDTGSLIHVDRNAYSVNSRLIGELVEARLYLDRIEVWYGQRKVEELPRLRGRAKHRVDYRHIIEWLIRKPGAFENYRYKEDLFPTSRFRMAYDALQETMPQLATKEYLRILELAAKEGEVPVDQVLRELLERKAESAIGVAAIEELLAKLASLAPVTSVEVAMVDLSSFDQLYTDVAVQG
ncbi:MAG: IS21 family transposase [Acidobacteriota bacterium]|nr:IS21 family transposase [Acidobacteriota bacterium]